MRSAWCLAPVAIVLMGALAACERSRTTVPRDTVRPAPPESVEVEAAPPVVSTWNAAAGRVMLVRTSAALTRAYVIFPEYSDSTLPDTVRFDTRALQNARVELVGHGGQAGSGRVLDVSGTSWLPDSCMEWPTARLALTGDSAHLATWTVAFEHSRLRPVHLDSIQVLPSADSARLAADITRLVAALPGDTSRTFREIPFSVRVAYRFVPAPGVQGLVADVVQKLNQEATPLERHTLLVAERDSANPQTRYRPVYHERIAGSEESIETTDVLAGVQFPTAGHVALVLVREGLEATAYALLERSPRGRWHVRWTSVHTGC